MRNVALRNTKQSLGMLLVFEKLGKCHNNYKKKHDKFKIVV